jgi:LytS/YehU family sensor histidine kinase
VEKTNASLKYEAAIFEIELNQLKSQLNPHFIFNALNSIRALVDEDPDKSKTAITQLSNILRNSLVVNRRKLIDLKDEIKTVMDYLALESVRFEERLSVFYNIDPATTSCQVPPLMLQTLVENGIKHGISKLTYGGQIRISARINEDNNLEIEIRNSGQFSGNGSSGTTGLGIENTRRRLDLLYGSRSQFQIRNEDDATVLTRIIIPQSVMYESIDRR